MAKSSSNKPRARSKSRAKSPAQLSAQRGRNKPSHKSASSSVAAEDTGVINSRAKRDIAAIAIIVVSVGLLISVSTSSSAVVTSAVSFAMKMAFGVGAYILPIFALAIGAIMLVRTDKTKLPLRMAVGFLIIFVALLGIMSLNSFGAAADSTQFLFTETSLMNYGGYVGSAIAYAGITLFGHTISLVIMAGLIAAGLAVIGFSVSTLVAAIKARTKNSRRLDENSATIDGSPKVSLFSRRGRGGAAAGGAGGSGGGGAGSAPGAGADDYLDSFAAMNADKTMKFGEEGGAAGADLKRKRGKGLRKAAGVGVVEPIAGAQTSDADLSTDETILLPAAAGGVNASGTAGAAATSAKKGKKANGTASKALNKSTNRQATKKSKAGVNITPSPDANFELPSPDMLAKSTNGDISCADDSELQDTAETLQQTLSDFGIDAIVKDWVAGPTVTLFKVSLPHGVRVNRVIALNNDIALALAAPGVRIFAPIPGTNFVGIEVPNQTRQTVLLGDILQYAEAGPLQVAIGRDVEGNCIVSDLAKMPHLLIGGTTGSGKSVSINAMIMSILMRATPSEVRLIMIDPKRVEFSPYNGIPHLYVPVVTEPKEAASALSWGVAEMERRLKVFSAVGARNIAQYNAKAQEAAAMAAAASAGDAGAQAGGVEDATCAGTAGGVACANAESAHGTVDAQNAAAGASSNSAQDAQDAQDTLQELPYIVIIIDELADLMMNVGKEVEFSISRIAQLARAAGIHLIVATQRPSAKVVTGLIKANITNRIAFNVASGIDSRVILDTPGAENLIGLGDLLLSKPELAKPVRVQGCYVSEEEINAVVEHLKAQGSPEYHNEILKTNLITLGDTAPDGSGGSSADDDPLVWEAAEIVVSSNLGSTSNLQRRLKVGYARAGRIMDALEEKGVVGPPNGSKPREVLVDTMELETLKAFELNDE